MKIWVVVGNNRYEGCEEPVGVYSTRELADIAAKKHRREYDDIEVLEYELDVARRS